MMVQKKHVLAVLRLSGASVRVLIVGEIPSGQPKSKHADLKLRFSVDGDPHVSTETCRSLPQTPKKRRSHIQIWRKWDPHILGFLGGFETCAYRDMSLVQVACEIRRHKRRCCKCWSCGEVARALKANFDLTEWQCLCTLHCSSQGIARTLRARNMSVSAGR